MNSSPAQVFGIDTVNSRKEIAAGGQEERFRIVEAKDFEDVFNQERLSKEKLIQKIRELLQRSSSLRASLFQGWMVCFAHNVGGIRICDQGHIKEAQLFKTSTISHKTENYIGNKNIIKRKKERKETEMRQSTTDQKKKEKKSTKLESDGMLNTVRTKK